jgi:hypothetical protein
LPELPSVPAPPFSRPPLESGAERDPAGEGASGMTRGPPDGPRDGPTSGLCPRSAAAPTVPLPGRAGFELVTTLADWLPPGMAGPLNTWPSAPMPCSGPPPVTAKSATMIAAGMRTATREAP